MIQDFKPGNNSVDVLICLRASRVGGWAKTMSARVERQRCHRSSYFTVPISNSWKSNKAHIIFQMHARKTSRIHRKKLTTPCIHRLFQLIFQKICGSVQAMQENYILTFSKMSIFEEEKDSRCYTSIIDTCFSSMGLTTQKKRKENVQRRL